MWCIKYIYYKINPLKLDSNLETDPILVNQKEMVLMARANTPLHHDDQKDERNERRKN